MSSLKSADCIVYFDGFICGKIKKFMRNEELRLTSWWMLIEINWFFVLIIFIGILIDLKLKRMIKIGLEDIHTETDS